MIAIARRLERDSEAFEVVLLEEDEAVADYRTGYRLCECVDSNAAENIAEALNLSDFYEEQK